MSLALSHGFLALSRDVFWLFPEDRRENSGMERHGFLVFSQGHRKEKTAEQPDQHDLSGSFSEEEVPGWDGGRYK